MFGGHHETQYLISLSNLSQLFFLSSEAEIQRTSFKKKRKYRHGQRKKRTSHQSRDILQIEWRKDLHPKKRWAKRSWEEIKISKKSRFRATASPIPLNHNGLPHCKIKLFQWISKGFAKYEPNEMTFTAYYRILKKWEQFHLHHFLLISLSLRIFDNFPWAT